MTTDVVREPGASRIRLGESADFSLGGLHVSPAHRVVALNGDQRTLEPRVMQVLVALASARPAVVSRDELAETCWGGLSVGDDAINRCIVALRQLAKEFEPQPFSIETVPRVGYSLVEGMAADADKRSRPPWLTKRFAVLALAAMLVAGIGAFGLLRMSQSDAAPATIAVLPFRNLAGGDPYFAQGVGEEILGQLAREPQFRVAGRMSSARFAYATDFRDAGRSLGVDYVLEGSVRRQGDRVRVTAALVRVRDGIQLWTDSYDGQLRDVFGMQGRIGEAVATATKRRLVRAAVSPGARPRNGEAYNLYLTARGIIRTRDPSLGAVPVKLLREALRLDPGYAPAWSSLAQATRYRAQNESPESVIATLPEARRYAEHALVLAPDLAEAHAVMGMLLDFASPEAKAHLRRSLSLDPNSAEALLWLGIAHGEAGEFEQELASYRRAYSIDPLWFRTGRDVSVSLAELGRRSEAEAWVKRIRAENERSEHVMLGRIAMIFGDYSEAVRHLSVAKRLNPSGGVAQIALSTIRYSLGLPTDPEPSGWSPTYDQRYPVRRIQMTTPPAPDVWRQRNRNRIASEVYQLDNKIAAKLMLNAGRARELTATYASAAGLLGVRPRERASVQQAGSAALVAVALERTGHKQIADRLLREADAAIRAANRRGEVPKWFDADTAAVWAVQGRSDDAVSMLERAIHRGWVHAGTTDLPNLADEPAFASLRNHPRFRRIQARLKAHIQREKQEIARLKV